MTDQQYEDDELEPSEDDPLDEQEGKGYGEDEGEREDALESE